MKSAIACVLAASGLASAFPTLNSDPALMARTASLLKRQKLPEDPVGFSKSESNCGPVPCLVFDAKEQYVSTSGEHAYVAPGTGDIRGPCPGLNAAANHGYLPRNGLASIEQTVSGLGALYGMSVDLAAFLAAYAIALDGNIAQGLWSIGGPLPTDLLTGALLGTGQGISYSHNNYEGDGSIARHDAYTNNGDAHSLSVEKFEQVYAVGGAEDRYTMDKFRSQFGAVQQEAIATNPYYFTAVFSTFLVVPAAYNFVINFMSNHSAAEPSGYLDGYQFKQFFGITGEPGSFVWQKGQERIPENWYRRPTSNQYNIPDVLVDLGIGYASHPDTIVFGGNTGKPNSFVGVDMGDFTNGAIGIENLFEGDNFACLAVQLAQQGIPDFLNPLINNIAAVVQSVTKYLGPFAETLSCPEIGSLDFTVFQQFPGYKYSPTGPATNYKN